MDQRFKRVEAEMKAAFRSEIAVSSAELRVLLEASADEVCDGPKDRWRAPPPPTDTCVLYHISARGVLVDSQLSIERGTMRPLTSGRLKALRRGPRAGGQALALAADPLNRRILRGMTSRTVEMGGELYELSEEGREALFVAAAIERWLGHAPDGPIEFESAAAERAVAALVGGWSAAVVHGLAREPMTSAELNAAIDGLGRRRLRGQLRAMHGAGLVEALGEGKDALYAMTDWLRRGIAPLIAAARLELEQGMEGATPVDGSDVEAGFRMALALVELPEELSGVCSLRIKLDERREGSPNGVTARIERGAVVSCEAGTEQDAEAWALGSLDGWLDTVIDPDAKAVRTGGDAWLTDALISAIHTTLFGARIS